MDTKQHINALLKRVEDLTNLLNASLELNSNLALHEVLQNVLNTVCKTLLAEAGTLWLVDQENDLIRAEVAYGPTKNSIIHITLARREGIVGRVIETKQSELVEDVSKHQEWASRVDEESGFTTHSLMTIPLIAKGSAIGALQLVNKQGINYFNPADLHIAEALAGQSALAIHNGQMFDALQRYSMSLIRSLTLALDARDPYTAGHSNRVAMYSVWTAQKLGLSDEQCKELERAAILHDIGKIGVPDYILGKTSRLTDEEFEQMKLHTVHGYKILSRMEPKKDMQIAQIVARSHHEKLDGSGYPDGLTEREIPYYAKIVAVADAFDAMTTERPYSKGRSYKEGVEEILRCKGSHFDATIADAFAAVLREKEYKINNAERTSLI